MGSPSEAQGIDLLFKKLGHDITEIRTRALESIFSKLKHGLIHEADIVQERQLLVRLLEWFNFNPSPKQDLVLQLLARLTKHPSACEQLVSLGAVTFLSKLRSDIDSNLRSDIDSVLDHLLHVTNKDIRATTDFKRCEYGIKQQTNGENQWKKEDTQTTYGYFTPQLQHKTDDTKSTITPPIPTLSMTDVGLRRNSDPMCLRFPGFPWHSLTGTDRHVLMSTGASLCSPSPHSVRNACAFLLDVIFRDFPPEIFLQRPGIIQTLLTLISSRPGGQLMSGALMCLQALSEGLHSRLHFYQDPSFYCPRQGLPFHCNNASRSRISDLESFSDSDLASRLEAEGARRFERSVGDGRDERSSSSALTNSIRTTPLSQARTALYPQELNSLTWDSTPANDESENDLSSLQQSTITTPQYCVSSLIATLPSFKTESSRLALSLFQTTIPLVKLLHVSIRSECLWKDKSALAQNLQSQIRQLLEIVGDALLYHYHMEPTVQADQDQSSIWSTKRWSEYDAKMHRLVFQALTNVVLKFLKAVLPIDEAQKEIKSLLCQSLFVIACDQGIELLHPEDNETACMYLEQCNLEKYEIVSKAKKISNSFFHTQLFLKDYQAVNESDVNLEIMEFAESSILGLPYHSDTRHLKDVIRAISKVFFNASMQPLEQNQLHVLSKRVLLRLLAHPLILIRRTSYDECLRLLKAGISVNAAAENLGHTASYIARFLIHSDILYEICCHGLGDSSRLVSHPAQEIMSLLLQGRLLIAQEVWDEFSIAMEPVLPILQAYSADTKMLQSAVHVYITPKEHPEHDWEIVYLKACLRSLMLKHRSSRSIAANQLIDIFSEKNSLPQITGITDILMVDTPLSLVPRDETNCFRIRRCVFQEDAVLRMLSVFRSSSTEESIRVGALRQLATMLDDPGLHDVFINKEGLETICGKLLDLTGKDISVLTEEAKPALASCIMIIKLLVRRDSVARERMSRDYDLLVALLRAADLCRLSVASVTEVSIVIALLVFHDVLKVYVRPKEDVKILDDAKCDVMELSLPASVITHYQIPFLCPSHHAVSIHRTLVTLPSPSCDPLLTAPPPLLRIAWNLAKFDNDVPELCRKTVPMSEKDCGSSTEINLNLNKEDLVILKLSDPSVLSNLILDSILNSKSHPSASHAFSLMRIALISSSNYQTFVKSVLTDKIDSWKEVLEKFLCVAPTCYEDEVLLANLTALIDDMLVVVEESSCVNPSFQDFLFWFLENCVLSSDRHSHLSGVVSPLLRILESSEPQPEPVCTSNESHVSSVTIRRQLCKSILSLLSRAARLLQNQEKTSVTFLFHRHLRTVILLRLRLADAPQFYDVPSMEITLECLVYISAARLNLRSVEELSSEPTDKILLQQLVGTLLEIVSAFHIRSGASNMSYMGKGVSRCATQCILHLARELSCSGYVDWSSLLNYAVPGQPNGQGQSIDKFGLEWLIPLWSARDPQMRFSGFAISSLIGHSKAGAIRLANSFSTYSGGIWNMVLCAALDHSECSSVRSQAFNLLSNLISHTFDDAWQGPVMREEQTGSNVTGLPALILLLNHAHLYEHISLILSWYHPYNTVRSPANLVGDVPLDKGSSSSNTAFASHPVSTTGTMATDSVLTQTNFPNHSPTVSSANKETVSSEQLNAVGTIKQHKTSPYTSSPISSLPDGWRSLTTPSLVSALCTFFCNLMAQSPHDTLHSLMVIGALYSLNSILDAHHVQTIFDKLSFASSKQGLNEAADNSKQLRRSIHLRHLIEQHESVARLLTFIVSIEKSLASRLLHPNESIFKKVIAILDVNTADSNWAKSLREVRLSVLEFLCAVLYQSSKEPLPSAVLREWKIIYVSILSILADEKLQDLQSIALKALALIFKSESISRSTNKENEVDLTWLLEKEKGSSCDARELTRSLANLFESLIVHPSAAISGPVNDKLISCCHAFQNLLACSKVSKQHALEAGFLERCVDELKNQHTRMTLQFTTIQATKSRSSLDSKSSSTLSEHYEPYLRITNYLLPLLTNLMHDFIEAKEAGASYNLPQVLSSLWSWSSHFSTLLIPLLKLTVTYTANCSKASSSITISPVGSQTSVASALVKLCREVHTMAMARSKLLPTPVLALTFNTLINSVIAQECRALIWKVNLLELFPASADRGQHPKRSKQQTFLLDCWLRLLLALSFHTDDFLHILLELFESNISNHVLIIIRNLCFHGISKNRLSSNSAFVRVLLKGLASDDDQTRSLTSTAILSLLHNNQKAKVHLKGAGLIQNLQNALARLTLVTEELNDRDTAFKKTLNTMLDIMRL